MAHYSVFGVPFDADVKTIGRAYRRLTRKYHLDVGPDAERFRVVVAGANRILGGTVKRDNQLVRARRLNPEPLAPQHTGSPFRSPPASSYHRLSGR